MNTEQVFVDFLSFWKALNNALAYRSEPEALFQEARAWWEWRPIKRIDERLINRVINERKSPGDCVMRAMKDEQSPLPDAVAAAWKE